MSTRPKPTTLNDATDGPDGTIPTGSLALAPFQQAEFEILFADGISSEGELLRLGLDRGVLHRRGNRVYEGQQGLGSGRNEVVRLLKEDAELAGRIREAILERMKG